MPLFWYHKPLGEPGGGGLADGLVPHVVGGAADVGEDEDARPVGSHQHSLLVRSAVRAGADAGPRAGLVNAGSH